MDRRSLQRQVSITQRGFLREFLDDLDAPRARLVRDVFNGMRCSGSLLLTEISRRLQEPIALLYSVKRLSRGLGGPRFDVACDTIAAKLLGRACARIGRNGVVAVDISDLAKPYARRMEGLCRVWDGSSKATSMGYWLYEAYHVDAQSQPHILQWRPYSTRTVDFLSENSEFLAGLYDLVETLGGRGVLVMDRGTDRREIMKELLEYDQQWIIRQVGNRDLVDQWGQVKLAEEWARGMVCGVRGPVAMMAWLPGLPEQLWFVAASRWDDDAKPLMLLCRLRGFKDMASRAVGMYRKRWRAEDAMRAAKQGLKLEGFLVRSMFGIRGLITIASLVVGFACELIAGRPGMCREFLAMPQRLPKAVKVLLLPVITAIMRLAGPAP